MLRPTTWLRVLLLAILAAATAWSLLNRETLGATWLSDFIDDHPGAMPAVFVVLHVAASLAFLPRGLMALAAGGLFGTFWGCVVATAGVMAGAMAGFLAARYLNASRLRAERVPRVGHLLKRAEGGGWRLVMVSRLVPVLPHSLVNYVYGLSAIPARDYATGTLLGTLPQTVALVQLGEAGATAASGGSWLASLVWGASLLAASALLPRLLPARWRR
ncbi:MAG: TVP38/TMEM64 family protein [Alphaproteobacteria bacterium]|nr:TVP38/TMEM64 family protein [Alphaproteobacteria bacterium]